MRGFIVAIACVSAACSSSFAQDEALQDPTPAVPAVTESRPLHSADVGMWMHGPYIVRKGQYTLIFPLARVYLESGLNTFPIPFLLAVKHECNAFAKTSDSFFWPTPLKITTPDTALTATMECVPRIRDGKGYRPSNMRVERMRFITDDMSAGESLDFDLKKGRAFVVSLVNGSRMTTVRQLRGDMFDPTAIAEGHPQESYLEMISGMLAWWEKIEKGETESDSTGGPRAKETAGSVCPPDKLQPTVSQSKQHTSESSDANDMRSQDDQKSSIPSFVKEPGLRLIDGGSPGSFIVRVGTFSLVFTFVELELKSTDGETTGRLEETIPFLLAVNHPAKTPVISMISPVLLQGDILTSGSLVIGEAPPLDVRHAYDPDFDVESFSYSFSEEMEITLDEVTCREALKFDVKKGRVFVVSVDEETREVRVKQLQIDMFDAKTTHSNNGSSAIEKKIAGVASWWKSIEHRVVKSLSDDKPRTTDPAGNSKSKAEPGGE